MYIHTYFRWKREKSGKKENNGEILEEKLKE